ncbi:family 1 glycosylhydrolase [Deinococcus radiotolerans]|uniref:RmlD-like substrate binding domain-containing protein n=1 Tax=Deinococcus radiotolerans TaxID=1309407 RepID=A0ABQ2FJH4_9DEIO|nr:family 1 glycosylhydrolase [Deinococcus radiotolerans]GGK99340.1 hypothetical protein GCM10010844_16940 [Deinococcus radiotolerans]
MTTPLNLPDRPPLHLWAGLEPTVSRVRDWQLDQLHLTGTDERPEDMDRLADLGVHAVRFPLLWERTAPQGPERADWRWADVRLERLQARGVQPIAGLVHHGSGPRGTHLLDPGFVTGLVEYARAVARRYPHVTAYTPVNEPLTTARFSALYGHWYPHARSEASCWTALKHQLQATVLAMRAVRDVQPGAQLIQTEDLGKTFSTPDLAQQADFENERRWLSFDLLSGRVTPEHRMWGHLRWAGATERDLWWFVEHACPPDVLGLNVYVTGERFLDSRLERYPLHTRGGNSRDEYADVEAVRVRGAAHGGPAARLAEAHERYARPLALTEVHLHCTREEQLRWLWQAWQAAQAARVAGVDVRAVTAWSALGACEWNSLLTRQDGQYESGLWDVRAPQPRPTALVRLAQALSSGAPPAPIATTAGWWARPERHLYPVDGPEEHERPGGPALLIVGAPGPLRTQLLSRCALRGLRVQTAARCPDHLTDLPEPTWAVAHLPGAPQGAATRACAEAQVPLLTFTSADIFSGPPDSVWTERDHPVPTSVRGQRQLGWEQAALGEVPGALVVRSGPTFGQGGVADLAARLRRRAAQGEPTVLARRWITPVHAQDLFDTALDLLIDGETGVWHLSSGPAVLNMDWARQVLRAAHVPAGGVRCAGGTPTSQALGSVRGWPLRPLTP